MDVVATVGQEASADISSSGGVNEMICNAAKQLIPAAMADLLLTVVLISSPPGVYCRRLAFRGGLKAGPQAARETL